MATVKADNRREAIIDAAARQFAKAGYDGTSMRDIASRINMLPGSLYYYFGSKEELFVAVHEEAIQRICNGINRAINPAADPWTRLEQAAAGYLEAMLQDSQVYASLIVTEFPRRRSRKLRDKLITHRDRFERMFGEIVEALPLKEGVDRSYWRLALLGMLAWTYVWYRPSGDTPTMIASKLVHLLRDQTIAERPVAVPAAPAAGSVPEGGGEAAAGSVPRRARATRARRAAG